MFLGISLYSMDKSHSTINDKTLSNEYIVNAFNWAQWDCMHQILYYIHYRKPVKALVEGEEQESSINTTLSPVLSGLQFHDDLPHETVVSILFIIFNIRKLQLKEYILNNST